MEQNNLALNMRITKLEESYFSLSAHLEGERVLRKDEDDKCKQLCDFLAKEISELKGRDPMESLKEVFLSLKEELINSIDTKIESKILEQHNHLNHESISNEDKRRKKDILAETLPSITSVKKSMAPATPIIAFVLSLNSSPKI